MTPIAKVYLGNSECSFQEAVYHILPGLKLRTVFPGVHFVKINLPEQRARVLLSEKECRELPEDSANIFNKSNTDRYMERPNSTLLNGKSSVLNDFCYAVFSAYLTFENR